MKKFRLLLKRGSHFIEVEKAVKLDPMSPELREQIRTLQHHPGFVYLSNKLSVQKAAVQHSLNEGYNLDEKALRFHQAGIFWLSYLQRELAAANAIHSSPTRPTTLDEERELEEALKNLELVR